MLLLDKLQDFDLELAPVGLYGIRDFGNPAVPQPVNEEYRLFMWQGKLLAATPAIRGNGPFDLLGEWEAIARRFENQFISMDIARQQDGSWLIVEVGDGGVTGLPSSIEPLEFYRALHGKMK